jgi:hypothetical protein
MRDTPSKPPAAAKAPRKKAATDTTTPRTPRTPRKRADAAPAPGDPVITVRRIHRRDLNKSWEFLKLCFREVNRETVEYQRPRSKKRFVEVYEEEGVEQLIFEATKPRGWRLSATPSAPSR